MENILSVVGQKRWNVYAKAPFGGPAQIIEYLGRYTHKVAITAHRILEINESHISFTYKDYADGNKQKIMTLLHEEFLRRFEQHRLPKGFVKIRHAGYLDARDKMKRIEAMWYPTTTMNSQASCTYSSSFTVAAANRQRHFPPPCMRPGPHGTFKNLYLS